MLQRVGVARRSAEHRLGGAHDPELGRVGAADDDQPGALVARDQLAVAIGTPRAAELTAARARLAGVLAAEVLEQERHAGEAAGPRFARLAPRALELGVDHR